jgi:hypothetical protein
MMYPYSMPFIVSLQGYKSYERECDALPELALPDTIVLFR